MFVFSGEFSAKGKAGVQHRNKQHLNMRDDRSPSCSVCQAQHCFPLFVSHWWALTTRLTNMATVNCTHGKAIKGVESLSKLENCLLFSGLFEENRAHLQTWVFPQVVSSGDEVVKFRQTPAAMEISNELLMCDKAADASSLWCAALNIIMRLSAKCHFIT